MIRRILCVSFRVRCLNAEVRLRTGGNPLSEDVRARQLCLFGHLARANPSSDYALYLCTILSYDRHRHFIQLVHVHCTHSHVGHQRTVSVHLADQGQRGCGQLNQTSSMQILIFSLPAIKLKTVEAVHEDSHAPVRGTVMMMMMMMMLCAVGCVWCL